PLAADLFALGPPDQPPRGRSKRPLGSDARPRYSIVGGTRLRVYRLTARPFRAAAGAPSALWRVGDRGLHHRAELVAQQEAVEVAHLHHVERDQPLLRVDPEHRAVIGGPSGRCHGWAARDILSAGTQNAVSVIPRGRKMRSSKN